MTRKLEKGNFEAAIQLICSDDRPATDLQKTLAALQAKHPPSAQDRKAPCSLDLARFDANQMIDSWDIINPVRSLLDQLLVPMASFHIKHSLAIEPARRLLSVQFVNLLLNGGLSQQINEIIFGANLIA